MALYRLPRLSAQQLNRFAHRSLREAPRQTTIPTGPMETELLVVIAAHAGPVVVVITGIVVVSSRDTATNQAHTRPNAGAPAHTAPAAKDGAHHCSVYSTQRCPTKNDASGGILAGSVGGIASAVV